MNNNNEFTDFLDFFSNKEKKGLLKSETDLLKEFDDFLNQSSNVNRIDKIKFNFYETQVSQPHFSKLAADSGDSFVKFPETYFYVNEEQNIGIRITEKTDDSCVASVISNSAINIENTLLYCKQTDKFFLKSKNNDFPLGYFRISAGQIPEFELYFLKDMILFRDGIFSPKHSEIDISDISYAEGKCFLKIKPKFKISSVVIENDRNKDFLNFKNDEIIIPEYLLVDKTYLFVY